MRGIYLDYNATTPLAAEVAEAMQRVLDDPFGNPSSDHWAGAPARAGVERAREQVSALLGCAPGEIVFTSGGSEANNLAIKGTYFAQGRRDAHIVTTTIEHPAVHEPCRFLEAQGATVTRVSVGSCGLADPDDVAAAITPKTILVSVMHANNEVGTVQPIRQIAEICRERGVSLHTDAAQSVGKIGARVDELGVDLLSVAGHKLYGPKGVGALYVRGGTKLTPLIHGAGHEHGLRAGTESLLLDTGLGAACELAADLSWTGPALELRDRFWEGLFDLFGNTIALNGHPERCLPTTLNVSFLGMRGADILALLPEVAASTGSACHAGGITPSPVLQAMGADRDRIAGAVRFSLGRQTTWRELARVLRLLRERVLKAGADRNPGDSAPPARATALSSRIARQESTRR